MQKHVERSPSRRATQPDVPLPPYPPRSSLSGHRGPGPPPSRFDRGSIGAGSSGRYAGNLKPFPIPHLDPGSEGSGRDYTATKVQEAYIAVARGQDILEKVGQRRLEWDRKVKRIQMQVVHAR
jgi:hypothetical protein